jgi:hypothetical protein
MMKRRALLIGAAGVLTCATAAWALKVEVQMTPRNLRSEGFKIKADRDGDEVKFVVERDLKKSTWAGRSGHLSLPADGGKSKDTRIMPEEKDGIQTYRFTVPKGQMPAAIFTVTEIQTVGNKPDGEALIGGGTYYRFRLADYTRIR